MCRVVVAAADTTIIIIMRYLPRLLLLALLVFPAALLLGGARSGPGESGRVRGGERLWPPEGGGNGCWGARGGLPSATRGWWGRGAASCRA